MSRVKVISQYPPGGRCTLYARYARAVADALGWEHSVVHSECRDAHAEGFPSLWVDAVALQPADGAILAPEDIAAHLADSVDAARLATLRTRLDAILDDFIENAG